MRRFVLLYAAPSVLVLLAVFAPVIRGTETLYLRDVLQAHFGYKTSQAEAWRSGYVPEIDPYRAGGQPLAGNPNTVPFYPDNLLYLIAPVLWSLNAHFWLHLLIAPFSAYWLGRAWGLRREASWAVGVCYGFSGFFISQLTFYNLIAGAALAPALVAACLRVQQLGEGHEHKGGSSRRRAGLLAAAGGLWALLVLSGDPFMALLAFLLAVSAVWLRAETVRPRQLVQRASVLPLTLAFAAGTLASAPQWIEFLRILPLSFRGHFGYGGEAGVLESFDPRQVLEWWLPLCFGRPDRMEFASFWGRELYGGFPAYYFSLYPGLLAVALVAASGRARSSLGEVGRGAFAWAWGSIGVGIFFALGGFNPAVSWVFEGGLLRFPIKCWLVVAVGASLLCGIGFERVFGDEGKRRRFGFVLGVLLGLYAITLAGLLVTRRATTAWLRAWIPERYSDAFVANEVLRWAGLAFFSVLLLGLMLAVFYGLRRRPGLAGALLLVLHVGTQLFFLAPIRATDSTLHFTTPPPALAHVPEGARVVHGSYLGLFGGDTFEIGPTPTSDAYWYARRTFYELFPTTGSQWRRHYQLNVSPEGLDGFLTEIARSAVVHRTFSDLESLRVLRAWGVEILLLGRELDAKARPLVEETNVVPGYGARQWIYRIAGSAPEALFAGHVVSVPDIEATVELLKSEGFDPTRTAVIPGDSDAVEGVEDGAGGSARLVSRGPESFEVEVEARSAGVLVVQRSHLGLWRAEVTGETRVTEPAEIVAANLQRMGVPLEAGRYRVRFWIDRRPLFWSGVLAVLGILGLTSLLVSARLARPRAARRSG